MSDDLRAWYEVEQERVKANSHISDGTNHCPGCAQFRTVHPCFPGCGTR